MRFPTRWRPNLLARIGAALALVGLLPLGLAAWQLVRLNRDAMTEQVLRSHIVAARTAADRAASFLRTRTALAAAVAADPALSSGDSQAIGALLTRSLEGFADLDVLALVLVDAAGAEVLRSQLADPGQRVAVDAALAREPVAADGPRIHGVSVGARFLVVIDEPAREVAATVRLVAAGEDFVRLLRPEEIGEQADLAMVDTEGTVLAGSIPSLDGFPPDLVAAAISGRALGSKADFRGAGGGSFLGAYAPVAGAPWSVVSRQPTAVAEAVAHAMRRRALLAVGGATALIALLAGAAYASLVRPLRRLAEAQGRLAKARPAAEPLAEARQGRAGDEIERLSETFAALERSIRDREALATLVLGRFQVVEFLGGGGMGSVFRGWDPKLERPVALKTVRLHRSLDPALRSDLVRRLIQEAITVARFNHPNIVAVYDVEDHPSGAFITMEFVDGPSLDQVLVAERRLGWQRAVPLGAAVARGLAAAHAAGVVHRDIKPGNVLLGRDGSIKVTDFGIAGLARDLSGSAGAPAEGAAAAPRQPSVGTPGYVPPESIQGRGYGPLGDLFALGALLYRATTGIHPFPGREAVEVLRRTVQGDVVAPRDLDPSMPEEVSAAIVTLLAAEPTARAASAGEAAARLVGLAQRHGARWQVPGTPSAGAATGDGTATRATGRPPAGASTAMTP